MDDLLEITVATTGDADLVLGLIAGASRWLKARGISQWTSPYPKVSLLAEIERGEVFVYRANQKIVATITLSSYRDPFWTEASDPALYLHRLVVDRSHAGKSLGKQLVEWAEQRLIQNSVQILRLDCAAVNSVLRNFYLSLGFEFKGIKYDDRYTMDFALFEKMLPLKI